MRISNRTHYLLILVVSLLIFSSTVKSQSLDIESINEDKDFNIAVCRQLIQIDENGNADVTLILICEFKSQKISIPGYAFSLNVGKNIKDLKVYPENKNSNYSIYFENETDTYQSETIIKIYFLNNASYYYNVFYIGLTYNISNFVKEKTEQFESPRIWDLLYSISKSSSFNISHRIYFIFPDKTRIDTQNIEFERPEEKNEDLFLELKAISNTNYSWLYENINKSLPDLGNNSLYSFIGNSIPNGQISITYNTPNYNASTSDLLYTILGYIIGLISIIVTIFIYLLSIRRKNKMQEQLKINHYKAIVMIDMILTELYPSSVEENGITKGKDIDKKDIELINRLHDIRSLLDV